MMKRILSFSAGLLLATYAALDAQTYMLTASREPYADLASPTIVTADLARATYITTAPFQFSPFGLAVDASRSGGLIITTSGYIAGKAGSEGYVISALMSTMGWRDSTSRIGATLETVEDRKVMKIEWRNVKLVGNPGDDSMNVQLWLFEKSGDFEIHIGPHSVSGVEAYGGYEGPIAGVARTNSDFSTAYRSSFIAGYDDRLRLDTNWFLHPMDATPRAGTVYRFTYNASASAPADPASASSAEEIRFLPNPCANVTMLKLPAPLATERGEVVLYDQLGREALRQQVAGEESMIATTGLPAGIYHAVVIARDRRYRAAPLMVR